MNQKIFDYTGEAIEPEVTVYNGDEVLDYYWDYDVEYSNNVNPGLATVKIIPTDYDMDEVIVHFTIRPIKMSDCHVSIAKTKYVYGNKAYKPTVTVKNASYNSLPKSFYKVVYRNNKKVGKATVVVTGNKKIAGKRTLNFRIIPKIAKKSTSIYVGQKYKVSVKSSAKISYKSSNKKVVKVNSKGIATALRKGFATITVKSNGQVSTMKITVKQPYIKISKAKVVSLNSSAKISVKKLPGNARVTWISSNQRVATVNGAGVVKGRSNGKVTITAKMRYAGKTYTSKCKVTVRLVIKMSTSSMTLNNSYYKKLSVRGGSGKITWKSSNKNVATVDSSGKVVGYGAGTCYIYAYRNGKKVSCKVTVSAAYPENSYVPDFGAMYGIHRDTTSVVDGTAAYDVTNYSNDTVAQMMSKYFTRLRNWGFSYYDSEESYDGFKYSYIMYDPIKAVVVGYTVTSSGKSYIIVAYGD